MKYFMISQDRKISNPIELAQLDRAVYIDGASQEEYAKAPDMVVTYFPNSQELEKPDALYSPAFLVSDGFRRLLGKYDKKMQFKGIRCYPENLEDPESLLYWWPCLRKIDCMSEKTEKLPNGLVKHLVVNGSAVQGRAILMVGGAIETIVLVSFELAESMLRRGMWGMDLEPVDMTGDRE